MTLKELITEVSFHELLPYLKEHEPEHIDSIYAYREAYDILRNMKPAKDFGGKIYVEWHGGEWEGEENGMGVAPSKNGRREQVLAIDICGADDWLITKS